jgi:LacI family transcriptional regulator
MADGMGRSASLRDIAEAAGVSIRTVTRVLKGTGSTSAAARARVMAVAERLGYRPNRVAQALRMGRTMEVAVLLSEISAPQMAMLRVLEETVRQKGYAVSVSFGPHGEADEVGLLSAVEHLLRRKPDGMACFGDARVDLSAVARRVATAGIPLVLLNPDAVAGEKEGRAMGKKLMGKMSSPAPTTSSRAVDQSGNPDTARDCRSIRSPRRG